ncbi:MAG: OmpA family protein [Myxococcaceae bacterium]
MASARPGAHRLAVITFASEDVTPGPEARAALSRVVAQWSGALLVEGHADPSGRAEGNEYFARVRARVVAKELVLLGVDPQRLTVIGRGALAPVDTRRSPAARARNRRVEVWRAP